MAAGGRPGKGHPPIHQLVPWFILGFLSLMIARSLSLIPLIALKPANELSALLTVVSMAALGLGVDVRSFGRAGVRVTVTAVLSLIVLGGFSWALLGCIDIA